MNLNKAMIIGNLTRDPEIRNTPSAVTVASFSIATNMVWTDQNGQRQEKVEYHNIVAWRRLAEICGQFLRKGSKVYIEGRMQTREWTGQDGIKRYRTEIIAENLIMLDRAGANSAQPFQPSAPQGQSQGQDPYQQPSQPQRQEDATPIEEEIKVEDIPF